MTTPVTDLEKALQQVIVDPSARPKFEHLLLDSELFIFGKIEGSLDTGTGPVYIPEGANMKIVSITYQNQSMLAAFTSIERLNEYIEKQRATGKSNTNTGNPLKNLFRSKLTTENHSPEDWIRLPAQFIFELVASNTKQSKPVVLNPLSDGGAVYPVAAIQDLLKVAQGIQRVVEKQTPILIGQPDPFPTALVNQLQEFFVKRPKVQAAYLAQVHVPHSNEPPHLLIGIQFTGDFNSLMADKELMAIIAGQLVEFTSVGAKSHPKSGFETKLFENPIYMV